MKLSDRQTDRHGVFIVPYFRNFLERKQKLIAICSKFILDQEGIQTIPYFINLLIDIQIVQALLKVFVLIKH